MQRERRQRHIDKEKEKPKLIVGVDYKLSFLSSERVNPNDF